MERKEKKKRRATDRLQNGKGQTKLKIVSLVKVNYFFYIADLFRPILIMVYNFSPLCLFYSSSQMFSKNPQVLHVNLTT